MDTPLLFIIFNRPDLTRRSFDAIRQARPVRLFVACDGPRDSRPGEDALVRESRDVVAAIDWPCRVERRYLDRNAGCKVGVATALAWFFEQVTEGIILEDDCLPDPSFFPFCAELLARYRDDGRVGSINGSNLGYPSPGPGAASYRFSRFMSHMGSWATWRRTFADVDIELRDWRALPDPLRVLHDRIGGGALWVDPRVIDYWSVKFDTTAAGLVDTWDYQWMFSLLAHRRLVVSPARNLVVNLGFRGDGTHTKANENGLGDLPLESMPLPLVHPPRVEVDAAYDRFLMQRWCEIDRIYTPKVCLRRLVAQAARAAGLR